MEVIEYKLLSKNPVLVSHAISRLYDIIKEKYKDPMCKDVLKIPEYKLLVSKFDNKDPVLTTSACQALISLTEKGILPVTSALCTLISHISSTSNYTAIALSMTHLLILDLKLRSTQDKYICSFTLQAPQHPFITTLKQEKNYWRAILTQMQFIMDHHDQQIKENSIEILHPVFIYILCDPSSSLSDGCKENTWQLLIKQENTLELQIEILLWLYTNNANVCIDTNCRVLEFAHLALLKKNERWCTALLPFLSALCLWLLKYGHDPRVNFNLILDIINWLSNFPGNIILALMCEIILICPAIYLNDILQICTAVIDKMSCNVTLVHALVASLLKWMAYPSVLCADALVTANILINRIFSEAIWTTETSDSIPSDIFAKLVHSDVYVQFYVENMYLMNTWNESNVLSWLKVLSKSPIDLRDKYKLILCGLFLQNDNFDVSMEACNILIQIVREINSFASHMLPLIMYKLTRSRNSVELKHLLFALPELIVLKENVPVIIQTLQTLLHSSKPLKYLALELYLKVQDREPKCYRHLSVALMETLQKDKSWYADITCAKMIKHICEKRPECAEELAPLISQILNKCVDSNGSTATALALQGISALCDSSVIGISSVWKVLAPKMKKEKRTIVLKSLCELLGNIPTYPARSSEEYDNLIADVLETLWSYVLSNDLIVMKAALKAISSFQLEQIPLKVLPREFKSSIAIQQLHTSVADDPTKNLEDALPYVPGTCWIEMLEKINKAVLQEAGDILISFIKNEVKCFRSGIYNWPHGEPNNFKYLPERSVIRAVGEYLRRIEKTKPKDTNIILECLRILAVRYPKPLPNINWNFLHITSEISPKAKEYSLTIACHHAVISLSAKTFIERYLLQFNDKEATKKILLNKEHEILYANLEDLCQTVQTQKLKAFLELTLANAVEDITLNRSKALFENIMLSYAKVLKNEETNDAIRTLLSDNLVKLFDEIDLTLDYFKTYITTVLSLSIKDIERMTSPSIWWVTPTKKLKNAIAIRVELALKNDTEMPLNWMSELIDIASTNSSVQTYLLEEIQRVQTEIRYKMYTSDWALDFINRIQALLAEDEDNNKIAFYCDIFYLSIICLSGIDCCITENQSLVLSLNIRARLFPQAITVLADIQYWKDYLIPKIMDWIHLMRTSSLPNLYKSTFHNALISLKHHPHYKNAWSNYLSVKTMI